MQNTHRIDSLVSIIIPTYNKANLAIETLKSVASQSYTNWECIVVDDESTPENYKVIQEFINANTKFSLHKRPLAAQKGANACRNYGLSLSKGKYIQFFDSDDLMLEHCLDGRVKILDVSTYDFVVFSMGIYNNNGFTEDYMPDAIVKDWESSLHAFLSEERIPWNLQRTLYKATLIKDKIIFNESLSRFQDIEFNIRLLSQFKPKFKIYPEIDCVYRRANSLNPRAREFNQNVFNSIPVFLNSIYEVMPSVVITKYRKNLELWLFNMISLYADKTINIKSLNNIFKSVNDKMFLNSKQKLILKMLFINKTKLKGKKGVVRLNSYLRKKYINVHKLHP